MLTLSSRQLRGYQRALKWLLGYIVTGYVVIMLVYYVGFCRPFSQYWAVPVQNSECATYQHYSIVQMVFNISSDIGLIIIPVMLFWTKAHSLPMGRRVALSAVFSMAVFTIIAAILNKCTFPPLLLRNVLTLSPESIISLHP